MADALSPDEQIALRIESTADVSGIDKARDSMGLFARDAARAQQQMAAGIENGVGRIPTSVRHAANAFSGLTFAISEGSFTFHGFAREAGMAAFSLAELSGSARLAATASGIGALVTVLSTVILLLGQAEKKAKEAGEAMAKSLGDQSDLALRARFLKADRDYQGLLEHVRTTGSFKLGVENMGRKPGEGVQSDLEKLAAERQAVLMEMENRRRSASRDASKEERQQEQQDAKRSKEMLADLTTSYAQLYDERVQSEETALRLKTEREFATRRAEIDTLKIDEDMKTALLAAAGRDRAEKLLKIHEDAAVKQNQIDEKLRKEEEARAERSLAVVQATMEGALDAAIRGRESFIRAATQMLLAPLIKRLEALAVSESIEGGIELIFGQWRRAGQHFAMAAAALVGAQKIAAMAGMASGGNAGGAPFGGAGVFGGEDGGRAGSVTVIIQTIDPTSKAVINEVGYQLQRNQILKQPVSASYAGLSGGTATLRAA